MTERLLLFAVYVSGNSTSLLPKSIACRVGHDFIKKSFLKSDLHDLHSMCPEIPLYKTLSESRIKRYQKAAFCFPSLSPAKSDMTL